MYGEDENNEWVTDTWVMRSDVRIETLGEFKKKQYYTEISVAIKQDI